MKRGQVSFVVDDLPPLWLLVFLGVFTVTWEVTAPVGLAWRTTRYCYLGVGVAAHVSMMVVLSDTWNRVQRLGVFAVAVFETYVLILDDELVERVEQIAVDQQRRLSRARQALSMNLRSVTD